MSHLQPCLQFANWTSDIYKKLTENKTVSSIPLILIMFVWTCSTSDALTKSATDQYLSQCIEIGLLRQHVGRWLCHFSFLITIVHVCNKSWQHSTTDLTIIVIITIITVDQTAAITFCCTFTKFWIHTQPFYGSLDFVSDNPGEPVPEETFTHSHLLWSSIILYLLPPSIMIHGILPVQFTFSTISLQVFFGLPLALASSTSHSICFFPNHCLLFAAHPHTITTCFAIVSRLCYLILVSFSTFYLELYFVA